MKCNKMTCPNCHTLSCYVCRVAITGYEHFDQVRPFIITSHIHSPTTAIAFHPTLCAFNQELTIIYRTTQASLEQVPPPRASASFLTTSKNDTLPTSALQPRQQPLNTARPTLMLTRNRSKWTSPLLPLPLLHSSPPPQL